MKDGLKNVRVVQVATLGPECTRWSDTEASPFARVEQRAEQGRAVETGQAEPIDRAITGNEPCSSAITNQRIVADWRRATGLIACLWVS